MNLAANCIFCRIIRKEIPAEIIHEDNKTITFLDIAPIHPGHALTVSKEHYETFLKTPEETARHMLSVVKKVADAILKATSAQGINIGINNGNAAGQIVMHTHYHIIPRFTNDGLKHWPQQAYKPNQMKTIAERIKQELRTH